MKCIQCGTDNTLKDRTDNQGRCKNCQHSFAFEPTSMGDVKITDPMFAKAIADLSANNTLFFTSKQLFYFLENRLRKKAAPSTGLLLFMFVFFNIWAPGFIGGILAAITHNTYFPFIFTSILINLIFVVFLARESQLSQRSYDSRRQSARSLQIIGGMILIVGMVVSLFVLESFPIYLYTVLLGMSAIYWGTRQRSRRGAISQTFLTTQQNFQTWLSAWQRVNPAIAKMLPPARETNPLALVNPDVTAYSFDRLVVCDQAAIAQLLIANNFHFENNCAILSITGYPQSIFEITMAMLRRNPDLKVYAIHDCTPKGIQLVYHLRSSAQWFQNSQIPIFDIGLLPRQIIASQGMFIQSLGESALAAKQLPSPVRQELSAVELTWLEAGNFVELESFSPQRLIHVLNHGIAGSRNLGTDDSSLILVGDSGSYTYASDSFG